MLTRRRQNVYDTIELGADYNLDNYSIPSNDKPYYAGCVRVKDKDGIEKIIPVKEGRWEY